MKMAKWESKTLAESGIIKAVGEQATAAIESVNAVMTLISGGAEVACSPTAFIIPLSAKVLLSHFAIFIL
jgi:hypothetical protein